MAKETFKDENGKEYTVIRDPRYTIPLALPAGIYKIVERIASNSVTSFKEREEASQKYYNALVKAKEVEAKLTPKERAERDERDKKAHEAEMLKSRKETQRAMEKFRKREAVTRQKYLERDGPPIVMKPLDENDPNVKRFRKDMDDLFGPPDPR
jgi:hypothetical protein